MSKKKGHGRQRHTAASSAAPSMYGSRSVLEPSTGHAFQEAQRLMQQKRWAEARDLLAPLAQRGGPDAESALEMLAEIYYELHDVVAYTDICERVYRLRPNDPEVAAAMFQAYALCEQPALAIQVGRRFMQRWPQHKMAADVRPLLALLEQDLPGILAQGQLEGEEGLETFALHEQALMRVTHAKYSEARELEERVLRRKPGFIPALNTISQSYGLEGRLDRAVEYSRRVLEHDPQNFHALGNLTRDLCLLGRLDEARATAERLKQVQSPNPDAWAKKVEALSFLGDDQGIMDVYTEAERAGQEGGGMIRPMSLHLAAVAAWRLGREKEARKLWQEALKLAPGLELAARNLEDLRKPVGERHAPWPFTLNYWLNSRTLDDLRAVMQSALGTDDEESATQAMRSFLQRHPEVAAMVPLLLDHGDPVGREFAMRVAQTSGSPEMLAALRDFAQSQRGPDALRAQAAAAASDAGAMPAGPTPTWMNGEWHDTMMLTFEIYDEPTDAGHSPEVADLLSEGTLALSEGDAARAETLLQQALALEPDAPDILNNLAAAYEEQGRREESEALSARVFEQHPDYFFGRISMAMRAIQKHDYERAKSLLEPLMARKRLHISEFRALANTQMELSLAQGYTDAVRSWLDIWESIDPDDPLLQRWTLRVAADELPKLIKGLTSRQRRRRPRKR
jgi:tetratricopeptide (TPR) repeat protein